MKPFLLLLAGLGMLVCACAPAPAGSLGPAPSGPAVHASSTSPSPVQTPAARPAPSDTATTPAPSTQVFPRTITFPIWLTRAGHLFQTWRTAPYPGPSVYPLGISPVRIRTLFAGPTGAEAAAGLQTAIPAGTMLRDLLWVTPSTATVDLNPAFDAGANARAVRLRLAQVIYTLTQFSPATQVRFEINGQRASTIGGISVQAPQTLARYADLLPAITVTSPVIDSTVTSPVQVDGTADVFEAVVSIRILDSAGHELARGFTNASCGTGCRGNYSEILLYSVPRAERGTIQVYEVSPKNGLPVNVQSIPVTLLP